MRILYLTNDFPYPLTSGYLRHYFLIKELSQRHTITLLSIVGQTFETSNIRAMSPFTEQVFTFQSAKKSRSLHRKAISQVRQLTGGDGAVRQMGEAIQQLVLKQRFDVVLCSGKQTYPAIRRLGGLPVVVDMCDATSVRLRGGMRYVSLPKRLLQLPGYWHVRRVERALIRDAAHLLFASCRDREALIGSSGNHATVVPNGVDLEYWKRTSGERGKNAIIFTGAMNYGPNTDAVIYLIEEILPLVKRSVPDAELIVVGRDPTAKLLSLGSRPGVTITGFVDDVRPYLERATVFAAPLRFGAGIQNKLLEAMAMEIPVIASPLAADGLRTEEGDCPPAQIAQGRDEFVQLIVQQLTKRAIDAAPDSAGRRFVERHFVWKHSAEKMTEIFGKVTTGTR